MADHAYSASERKAQRGDGDDAVIGHPCTICGTLADEHETLDVSDVVDNPEPVAVPHVASSLDDTPAESKRRGRRKAKA